MKKIKMWVKHLYQANKLQIIIAALIIGCLSTNLDIMLGFIALILYKK